MLKYTRIYSKFPCQVGTEVLQARQTGGRSRRAGGRAHRQPCLHPSSSSEWANQRDNRGNLTYTHNDTGFLFVNVRHNLLRLSDFFIFMTQVFYSNVPSKPGWRLYYIKKHVLEERYSRMQTSSLQHQLRVAVSLLQAKSHLHQIQLLWLGQFSSQYKINY
jgi:hypothetical protein